MHDSPEHVFERGFAAGCSAHPVAQIMPLGSSVAPQPASVLMEMWLFAVAGGAAVGALLNYALAFMFTWGRRLS